jgi:hypothetical protein
MTRIVTIALLAFAAAACDAPTQPTSDAGIHFDRDAETRYCLTDADCYEGEACTEILPPSISICRLDDLADAGDTPDTAVDVDADTGVAADASVAADAGPQDSGDSGPSCWISRNLNVSWMFVSIVSMGTTSCSSSLRPTALVTAMREPCTLGVGSTWSDGTTVNDNECERLGGTNSCAADLLYPAVLEGAALYRMPVVGDTITVAYDSCRATFRAQIVTEGAEW